MKKYSFRLESVRRVRRVQEDVAKSALLAANTEVQRAVEATEERMNAYQSATATVVGSVGVDAFMKRQYFNELAGRSVMAARANQQVAEAEAAAKRAAFTEAARKVKALDRLDEKGREDYRVESGRHNDAAMDEIVTSRFQRTAV